MQLTRWGLMIVALAAVAAALSPPRRQRLLWAGLTASVAIGLLGRLAWAFVTEDWRLAYVVDHTRPGLAWPLRAAGLWAGPEGSLLFFTTLLAVALIPVAARSSGRRGLGILSGLTAAYALIVAFVANPFTLLPSPPSEGLGLQPVLEHEAMTWHPPALYAGLIAALAAGALALGGEGTGQRRVAWSLALGLLTVGLATGSRWAHVELGWGGYWAWDPIENAGLVVWLLSAAALHRPRSVLLGPAVVIAAVWATTLTRIGVVASVHAFADDAPLRLALIVTAALATVGVIVATRYRTAPSPLGSTSEAEPAAGRRFAAWVLVGAAVIVAIGTYEPAVEALVGGDAAVVAGRFYSRLLFPLALLGTAAAVVTDRRRAAPMLGSVAGAMIAGPAVGAFGMILAAVGGAMAASAAVRRSRRGRLAHIGFGLLIIGIAGTTGSQRTAIALDAGETVTLSEFAGGTTLTHRDLVLEDRPGVSEAIATVDVDQHTLQPKLVAYRSRSRTTSEMAELQRFASLGGTIQVLLTDGDADRAVYQLYYQPRIGFVWLGSAVVTAGLLLPLLSKKLFHRRGGGSVVA